MARYVFVVHTNAVEGRDDEFNDWYSGPHLVDLRRLPGVVSARRFRIAETQVREQPSSHRYLAIYEIETDDPQGFARELRARAGTELLATSPALAADASAYLWEQIE
ncbi:DUF4286 family protein [Solimonas terrae]|uniref:DUF4286 family protein n=1 Tax=Solimonas terrae TaxID=1396819 RepID=A0A6M2BNE8_9GAMM|nr:DUF4286 family protein [Solimonas terrae]NGY03988.1 hypothetical protein [Solimonas terrae]